VDLKDIYTSFHSTAMECILFSAAHRTSSKRDHILEHKTGHNKKIKIIYCTLPDYTAIKLQINIKRSYRNCTNTRRLDNTARGY
jgi:hypothetical protein